MNKEIINSSAISAAQSGLSLCEHCGHLSPSNSRICHQCHSPIHQRKPQSLQCTLAFLFTAILLYIPANTLPIMQTTVLGDTENSTIIGGVLLLWQMGSYPIAAVIFIASIIVPIAKMIVLLWLCLSVWLKHTRWARQRTVAYRITELIGRWSMVDVFVVVILVGLVQLGSIASIYPGSAALAFAGVVIFTMFSANSFDPRLIWDQLSLETAHGKKQ